MAEPRRYHDIGGRLDPPGWGDDGAIDRTERALFHWERQCAAMRVLLGEAGLVPLDELRDCFETFGEDRYVCLSFFERMLTSMLLILERKAVVSPAVLDESIERVKQRHRADAGWFSNAEARRVGPFAALPDSVPDPYGGTGYLPVADAPPTHSEWRTLALIEVLVERNVFTREALQRAIERIDAPQPAWGARIVARAWVDADFRKAILDDGRVACEAFGIPFPDGRLAVVANEPDVHCVVVCTLCSCYPRNLLGQPPAWYVSKSYRTRTVREPRAVLSEFGLVLGEDVRIDVYDSTADLRYMVLPCRPRGTGSMDEAALAALVSRDCLIGVALPKAA